MSNEVNTASMFIVSPARIYVAESLRTRFNGPAELKVLDLQERIRDKGQLQPIGVTEYTGSEDFDYTLVFGEHRLQACANLGIDVNCVTVETKSEVDHMMIAFTENNARNEITALDRMTVAKKLRTEFKKKGKEIALAMGLENAEVTRLKSIEALSETLHNMMGAGNLNMGQAVALLRVDNLKTREDMAGEGWTAKKILDWVAKNQAKEDAKNGTASEDAEDGDDTADIEKTGEPGKGRTLSDVRTALAHFVNVKSNVPNFLIPVGEVCQTLLDFITGEYDAGTSELFDELTERYKSSQPEEVLNPQKKGRKGRKTAE